MNSRHIFQSLVLVGFFTLLCSSAMAQFTSGSTGADGALDTRNMTCNTCVVQIPESGILNYTYVYVGTNKNVRFSRNRRNTPVTLLVQSDVSIVGFSNFSGSSSLSVSANGREPGPGGFYGAGAANLPGAGPGGGTEGNCPGQWIGPLTLVPLVGGSGGCYFNGSTSTTQFWGGAGGGAITIAASGKIAVINGTIFATGSMQRSSGSGGAIRLVANEVELDPYCPNNCSQTLIAVGAGSGATNHGVIRIETPPGMCSGCTSWVTPAPVLTTINPTVIVTSQLPTLTILSIGASAVPLFTYGSTDTIDLLLPQQLLDPIPVVIGATNVPVGATVSVNLAAGSPYGVSTPCTLGGSLASSSCTAAISNLNRSAITHIVASVSVPAPAGMAQFNKVGPNQVAEIRADAALGAKTTYTFLNARKEVIKHTELSSEYLRYFGL